MKIGFVFDDSLDLTDGVQQYVLGVSKWLDENGHEIHYLVGHTARKDIENIHSLSKTLRVKFNGNVVGTPLPANQRKIKDLLNSLKLDILHVQMPYSPVLAGRVINCAPSKTAIVGTLHIFPNSNLEHGLNKLLKLVNSKTLNRFDQILAVSEAASKASHIHSHDIKIVPNPVDISSFNLPKGNSVKHNKIIFMGRLVKRKGCLTLLRAINHLNTKGLMSEDWKVEIGGDGQLRKELEDYVDDKKLNKYIDFKGFIPEEDKPNFIASSKIAVFPSTGGESFGIVLLEAMASGAVTLAGNNSGYKCVMGNKLKSQVFTATDYKELSELIYKYMNDNEALQASREAQYNHVKQFDINLVGKTVEGVYQKALRSRGQVR